MDPTYNWKNKWTRKTVANEKHDRQSWQERVAWVFLDIQSQCYKNNFRRIISELRNCSMENLLRLSTNNNCFLRSVYKSMYRNRIATVRHLTSEIPDITGTLYHIKPYGEKHFSESVNKEKSHLSLSIFCGMCVM